VNLSGVGIWDPKLRNSEPGEVAETAAEAEELGYRTLWIYDMGGDIFGALRLLLSSTQRVSAGTSILNLWMHSVEETAQGRADLEAEYPGRLMIGIGVSHAPIVDAAEPGRYRKPLQVMGDYLDGLDAAAPPLPPEARMLAALRPRMLEMARDRSAGALPYHQTPAQTKAAREALGPGKLLVVEQAVHLERDRAAAREAARRALQLYIGLPNYRNAWLSYGFSEDDLADGGSDRFVDGIVAWGDEEAIRRRVQEHFDAGADQVCIQAAAAADDKAAREMYRTLAPALIS
jgi:probable F420-dependent oxidoreductase